MKNCLYCYGPLGENQQDYHPVCSKKIFGQTIPPAFPYTEDEIASLAKNIIESQTVVPGVQAKLSLHITGSIHDGVRKRFTIVGLWGGYIFKPPTLFYPELPEVEDLTMHLAEAVNIRTAPHCLLRMPSGKLAYITKRMDRIKKEKLAMEDMCQLTERLTEDKYQGSYEQIAKTILKYSATPGLDVINFFELVLFSFISGNADMHLKNFSLLEKPSLGMVLSPAYDLVNTKIINPIDNEELALHLNGKKNKIQKKDFVSAMNSLSIDQKQQENIFKKMEKTFSKWNELIDASFLSNEFKYQYKSIILERMNQINLEQYSP